MAVLSILGPAAVLVLWSLIVLVWLVVTRFPAFAKAGIKIGSIPVGARYVDAEKDLPPKVNWGKRLAVPPVKNISPMASCDFLIRSGYGRHIEMVSAY